MKASEYQTLTSRTNPRAKTDPIPNMLNLALGIAGESGEVVELIKKWAFHDHDLNPEEVTKEIGDLLWYVSELCNALEIPLGLVFEKNIDKLMKRYPEGFFTAARSRERIQQRAEQIEQGRGTLGTDVA